MTWIKILHLSLVNLQCLLNTYTNHSLFLFTKDKWAAQFYLLCVWEQATSMNQDEQNSECRQENPVNVLLNFVKDKLYEFYLSPQMISSSTHLTFLHLLRSRISPKKFVLLNSFMEWSQVCECIVHDPSWSCSLTKS